MAIRKIAVLGNPVLRRRAEEVPPSEVRSAAVQRLIDDMIETMRDADGAGIAAPQVHEALRICVIEVADNPRYPDFPSIPLTVLVNPVVTFPTDETLDIWEGCLSVPDLRGRVARRSRARVQALARDGSPVEFVAEGIFAGIVQHETDHLDGVLFVDRVTDPRTLAFKREYDRFVRAPAAD